MHSPPSHFPPIVSFVVNNSERETRNAELFIAP
jgi:hypothetical protein